MKSTTTNAGQIAILVGLIGLFILILAFAPMLSSSPLATTNKKFRAKAGTEREGARALVSDTASATSKDQLKGTRDKPLEAWDAPKNWERIKNSAESDVKRLSITTEVLNTLSPDEGIAHVRALLLTPADPAVTFELYAALGRLYAFRDPPDPAAANDAFDRAAEVAPSAEARHAVVRDRLTALQEDASPESTLSVIDEAVREGDSVSLATLQLDLLRAAALEKLGRNEESVSIYEGVMARALEMRDEDPAQAEDVYRQGALRLARHYRDQGRDAEANMVARQVKQALAE